jgi:hypothetical protein
MGAPIAADACGRLAIARTSCRLLNSPGYPNVLFFPERVALAGIVVYLILFLIAPLQLVQPVAWESFMYIGLCYAFFFAGVYFVSRRHRRTTPVQITARFTNRAFWVIAFIGATGMAMRLADKFLLRGMNVADMAVESRKIVAEAGAGWIAAFGGALYPLCYVPLILWWARSPATSRLDRPAMWFSIALFALPAIDALVLLSRSLMLVALFMMYFSAACVLYQGRALDRRLLRPALLGVVGITIVSAVTFSMRLSEMVMDQVFSILNSGYAFVLPPTQRAIALMTDPSSYIGNLLVDLTPLLQYYLHGIFEFGLLWERPDPQPFTLGMQHFAPYFKVLSLLGVTGYSEYALEEAYYRAGVFTSFFGPVWVDFGWLGPLVMALFGALLSYIADVARGGAVEVIPLYAFFCVVVFFMPVTNLLVGGQGMYAVNAFLLVWLVGVYSRRGSRPIGIVPTRI